ncbi:MAG: hypothetical protein WBB19_18830 [Desulforhopalus sp.]
MNTLEKIFSVLAITFAVGLTASLIYFPQLRLLNRLIPICLVGFIINIGLLFIILRDIFSRQFSDHNKRYVWMALVLFFWPSILFYLPMHGFRPRVI